jgi:transcriptional regulator with XRE-family HTH domain
MDRDPRRLGENVRRLAGLHLLSQREIAERIGVTRVTISRICAGSRLPRRAHLAALAELFAVDVDDLFDDPRACVIAAAAAFHIAHARMSRTP